MSLRWVGLLLLVGAVGFSVARAMAPPGRYTYPDGTVASSQTVKDTVTGLTWQRNAPTTTYNWGAADSYCATNTFPAGTTGWRLPSVKELTSIVDFSANNPSIDSTAFPGTQASDYWTKEFSHIPTDSDSWWVVSFGYGTASTQPTATPLYVRCVTAN
jgi:hypothetical protein